MDIFYDNLILYPMDMLIRLLNTQPLIWVADIRVIHIVMIYSIWRIAKYRFKFRR